MCVRVRCVHTLNRIPSAARGSWGLRAQNNGVRMRGKDAGRRCLRILSLPRPFPTPACGSNSGAMEAPTVYICGKRPARERQPCLLDTLALGALHMTSTKLHKKTVIALTKWLVWDPPTNIWVTKTDVRLRMFAADKAVNYRDTRIRHQGRLIGWRTYTELLRQENARS